MKRVISMMMAATVAIFAVSCSSNDDNSGIESSDDYALTGEKYIGTMSILGMEQTDVIFYADQSDDSVDIMMPEASFMVGLMPSLDMALIDIPLVSTDPNRYYTAPKRRPR